VLCRWSDDLTCQTYGVGGCATGAVCLPVCLLQLMLMFPDLDMSPSPTVRGGGSGMGCDDSAHVQPWESAEATATSWEGVLSGVPPLGLGY
jgi:hypothetical protein